MKETEDQVMGDLTDIHLGLVLESVTHRDFRGVILLLVVDGIRQTEVADFHLQDIHMIDILTTTGIHQGLTDIQADIHLDL